MTEGIEMLQRQASAGFVVHQHRADFFRLQLPADDGGRNVVAFEIGEQVHIHEEPISHHDQAFDATV